MSNENSNESYSLRVAKTEELYNYNVFPAERDLNKKVISRSAYGRDFPGNPNDAQIELWCAGQRISPEDGGLGEFGHWKRVMELLFPYMKYEWNHWWDMQLSMLSDPSGTYTMLGGGGLGKSWIFGTLFARLWQAAKPFERGVMIINTTQKSQTERAWRYVIETQNAFPWLGGQMYVGGKEPEIKIKRTVLNPNTNKYEEEIVPGVGIISQTVKRGSSAQATADLKGLHPPELMVIIEESNHLNRNHLERARSNWITNKYYKIVMTGNPEISDRADSDTAGEDALYHFSTPVHGYGSMEWGKDRIWENKFGGKTLHFDPYDSPRVHDPARFKVATWFPDMEYIKIKARELGGENTQLFKQQIRGIYDHASLPYNPITYSMCNKFKVRDSAQFTGHNRQRWAGFDPAFSGNDEAFLKIAESGLSESGRIVIDFLGDKTNFSFKIDAESPLEPSFQMLEWVKKILKDWDVPPENFIMDANIIGIALGDIFTAYYSKKINKVVVSGKPSDMYVDLAQTYTAKDRCANKATELWMGFQQLMISGQIRGLDESIIAQLIEMPSKVVGGKMKVLEKSKFRKKFGYSPDRAECCLFIVDLLRQRGFKQGFIDPSKVSDIGGLGFENSDVGSMRIEDIFINQAPKPYTYDEHAHVFGNPFPQDLYPSAPDEGLEDVKRAFSNFYNSSKKR